MVPISYILYTHVKVFSSNNLVSTLSSSDHQQYNRLGTRIAGMNVLSSSADSELLSSSQNVHSDNTFNTNSDMTRMGDSQVSMIPDSFRDGDQFRQMDGSVYSRTNMTFANRE